MKEKKKHKRSDIREPPKFDTDEKRKQQEKDLAIILKRKHKIPMWKTKVVIRMLKVMTKVEVLRHGVHINIVGVLGFHPVKLNGDERRLNNYFKLIKYKKK